MSGSGSGARTARTPTSSPTREVDVVYVASPHNLHHRHALLTLDADKHVLVEKPIALNAAKAAARAAERNVFCAEALWTFYLPRYDVCPCTLPPGTSCPIAKTCSGSPSTHDASASGYVPRSSSAPPARSWRRMRWASL